MSNTKKTETHYGYLLLVSLVAAWGGFLFGYDTAVVSGAIGFLRNHFHLSADLTGWAAVGGRGGFHIGKAFPSPNPSLVRQLTDHPLRRRGSVFILKPSQPRWHRGGL